MTYHPGRMGVAEGTALVFLTTVTTVFLSRWSAYFDEVATAAWTVPFVGAAVFVPAFLVLLFVMARVPGDLLEVAERLLGAAGARVIVLYLAVFFFADAVLLLRQFAENTVLTAIPDINISLIMGWYMLMAAIAIYFGIEPLARAVFVMMPFGIIGAAPMLLMVYDQFDLNLLAPWLGNGAASVITTGSMTSGLYLNAFLLPLLARSFQDLKTVRTAALLGTGLSMTLRAATFFTYTGAFGVAVGREKVLPFFELARLVYLNRFIQRVETLFIVVWVIYGVATIAINMYVAIYLLTRLFRLPSMRPLIWPLAIIAVQLALLPPDIVTTIEIHSKSGFYFATFGVAAIPAVLLIALYVKGRKKAGPWAAD